MTLLDGVGRWSPQEKAQIDRLWMVTLGVAALILLTINLDGVVLRDAGEGTVAQVAREILQAPPGSMRWLYPTLGGEPYLNKPPLLQNLIAIAFHLGGIHEWTARLPSVVLTALSVSLCYAVGRELFFRQLPALLSALVYLTTLPVLRLGRLAMLEGAVLCFSLLLFWCVLRSRRGVRYSLGIGLAFGLLCLTKGLMLGLLMGAIALLFLSWDTPRLLKIPYLWLGIVLGSFPLAFWYAAQWWHYGAATLGQNLLEQSFSRIWTAVDTSSGGPWYYLLELLKGGLPWVLFVPAGLRRAWGDRRLGWARLSLLWSGIYLLAISLMATKLPWYSLPLYPPLSFMVGAQLAVMWEQGRQDGILQPPLKPYSRHWVWLFGTITIALVSTAGTLYLLWNQGMGAQSIRQEGWDDWLNWAGITDLTQTVLPILWLMGITMAIATALIAQHHPQFITILLWGTYLSLLMFFSSHHWLWEVEQNYPVEPVAAMLQQHTPPGELIYMSTDRTRPSLTFYSDRPITAAFNCATLPRSSTPVRLSGMRYTPELRCYLDGSDRLRILWNQESHVYFLLDTPTLHTLALPHIKILAEAEGWNLITKENK